MHAPLQACRGRSRHHLRDRPRRRNRDLAETRVQLDRLGATVGERLGVGRVTDDDWEQAFRGLRQLGEREPVTVVLDEFGSIKQADGSVDSTLAAALGPGARRRQPSRTRLVSCGSAISMMKALGGPESALRGRTGLELVM